MTKTTHDFFRPHKRVQFKNELVHPVTGEISNPPSRTKQSFVAECDINNIIKQFRSTGVVNHISANAAKGRYLDLPDELDFQTSLNTVLAAEQAFASLPSKIRTRFENDPRQFLEFLTDPANAEELVALGFATATPTAAPAPTPAPNPPPEPEGS